MRISLRWLGLVAGIASLGAPARALVIDDFTVAQQLSGATASGLAADSQVAGSMLGGSRLLSVGGVPPAFAATATIGGGSLAVTQSAAGQRFVDLIWQVDDAIDLTEGGTISAFEIDVDSWSGVGGTVFINVASDPIGLQLSQAHRLLSAIGPLRIGLDEFTPDPENNGNLADVTHVLSIALRIQTFGEATLSGGLRTVPEVGSGVLLLAGAGLAAVWRRCRAARGDGRTDPGGAARAEGTFRNFDRRGPRGVLYG